MVVRDVARRAVALALAVSLVLGSSACGSRAGAGVDLTDRALAGVVTVTGKGCYLHIIDLERGEEVVRKRLRSDSYQVAADERTRCFVTAQAGGVDRDADDRLGVFSAAGRGKLDYVELPYPNPGNVMTADGMAYAVCGVEVAGNLLSASVDLRTRSVTSTGVVPLGFNRIARAGDRLYESYIELEGDGTSQMKRAGHVRIVSAHGAPPSPFLATQFAGGGVVASDVPSEGCSTVLLAGDRGGESGHGVTSQAIQRIDAQSGEVLRSVELQDMVTNVAAVTAFDTGVAVLDQSTISPDGDARILVLDPDTLELREVIERTGNPVAIAGWRDGVLIADPTLKKLEYRHPGSDDPVFSIPIAGPAISVSMAVLEARDESSGRRASEDRSCGDSVDGGGESASERTLRGIGPVEARRPLTGDRSKEASCRTRLAAYSSSRTRRTSVTPSRRISSVRVTGSASPRTEKPHSGSSPPIGSTS